MARRSSYTARRSRRRLRTWALVAGATAAVGVVAIASAAQISVFGGDHEVDQAAPCTTSTLATTVAGTPSGSNYTQVQVSGIPAGCNNLDVELVVYDRGGTQLTTGTGTTGSTGTVAITTTSYDVTAVAGVALLVDTWGMRNTWTTPPQYVFTCVALNNGRNPWGSRTCSVTGYTITEPYANTSPPGGDMMDIAFTVVNTGVHWRVTIDLTVGIFPWTPAWVGQPTPALVQLPGGYTCPSPLTSITVEDIVGTTLTATVDIAEDGAPQPLTGYSTLCP